MADLRLLFYGDSFVAGVGDPEALGWAGRVVAAVHAQVAPVTAYNLGVRHETAPQVVARWRREAEPRLAAGADTRVVFSFGANDATVEDGRPRARPELSVAALEAAVDGAADLGLGAFVVGPPPLGDAGQVERIGALSGQFAELCSARGVPFVGVVEALRGSAVWAGEAARFDRRHPGAGGYAELAGLVLAAGFLDWIRGG